MRKLSIFLYFFFIQSMIAQSIVFNSEIKENNILPEGRLNATNHRMSSQLKYVVQSPFKLDNDLQISLFNGQIITAKYVSYKQLGIGTKTYTYQIENDDDGFIVFTNYRNWLDGFIETGSGEKYHIAKTSDNIIAVSKINPAYFKDEENNDEGDDEDDTIPTGTALQHQNVCTSAPCTNSVIDIMVFFSNQTIANVNGGEPAAITATANQVVLLNQSLISSGINNLQYDLVYAKQINYNDNPSGLSADKSAIKTGALSSYVNTLRNQYGADLVSIFCYQGSGTGDVNTSATNFNPNQAYSAINYTYVIGNYSLSHEIGHNMGLRHNWYSYSTSPSVPCSHHFGYVNKVAVQQGTASPQIKRWRTMMSYNSECASVGITCIRLNRWSNPEMIYTADPMGVAIGSSPKPADERYALMRTGCVVASFRNRPEACYKPPTSAGTALNTTIGITSLDRTGSGNENWPAIREGGWIALESKTKGFVINRVAFNISNNPVSIPPSSFVEGMMVYDITNNCLKIYTTIDDGATFGWYCFNKQTCPD
jgi:peptidyl-Asp metalloendopeptidase